MHYSWKFATTERAIHSVGVTQLHQLHWQVETMQGRVRAFAVTAEEKVLEEELRKITFSFDLEEEATRDPNIWRSAALFRAQDLTKEYFALTDQRRLSDRPIASGLSVEVRPSESRDSVYLAKGVDSFEQLLEGQRELLVNRYSEGKSSWDAVRIDRSALDQAMQPMMARARITDLRSAYRAVAKFESAFQEWSRLLTSYEVEAFLTDPLGGAEFREVVMNRPSLVPSPINALEDAVMDSHASKHFALHFGDFPPKPANVPVRVFLINAFDPLVEDKSAIHCTEALSWGSVVVPTGTKREFSKQLVGELLGSSPTLSFKQSNFGAQVQAFTAEPRTDGTYWASGLPNLMADRAGVHLGGSLFARPGEAYVKRVVTSITDRGAEVTAGTFLAEHASLKSENFVTPSPEPAAPEVPSSRASRLGQWLSPRAPSDVGPDL